MEIQTLAPLRSYSGYIKGTHMPSSLRLLALVTPHKRNVARLVHHQHESALLQTTRLLNRVTHSQDRKSRVDRHSPTCQLRSMVIWHLRPLLGDPSPSVQAGSWSPSAQETLSASRSITWATTTCTYLLLCSMLMDHSSSSRSSCVRVQFEPRCGHTTCRRPPIRSIWQHMNALRVPTHASRCRSQVSHSHKTYRGRQPAPTTPELNKQHTEKDGAAGKRGRGDMLQQLGTRLQVMAPSRREFPPWECHVATCHSTQRSCRWPSETMGSLLVTTSSKATRLPPHDR
jgi:hypothetical protein